LVFARLLLEFACFSLSSAIARSGSSFLAWPQRRTVQKRIASANRQKGQGLAVCTVNKKTKFQSYRRKIMKLVLLRRTSDSMIFLSSPRLKFLTPFLQGPTQT